MDSSNIDKRVYSSSCISCFLTCQRKFYFNFVRNIEPIAQSPALSFGSAMHAALLQHYKGASNEEAIKEFNCLPSLMEGEQHKNKEHAIVIFKDYIKRWGVEPFKTLHLEKKFAIELGDRVIAGRFDKVVEWEKCIYVVDHKTTSQLGVSFFRQFRPNVQIDTYTYACAELVGSCAGVIINGISTAANPKERFQRDISPRTPDEISRYKEQFAKWCEDIEFAILKKRFTYNYTSCADYGGCDYYEVCMYGMEELYKDRERDEEDK